MRLNAPNGGEVLAPGSVFTIQWTILIKHNQLNWDLWYSTTSNSGPWTSIAANLPAGSFAAGSVHSYDWTVPATPDGSVWVKVRMDNSGTNYTDVSNAPFAIGAEALASNRNGSGLNAACYSSLSEPTIGSTWTVQVDHSSHPGATFTYLVGYGAPASGLFLAGGEVLVDLSSPRRFVRLMAASGTADTYSFPIPNDPSLAGASASSQAIIFGGPEEFCNAVDVTLGF